MVVSEIAQLRMKKAILDKRFDMVDMWNIFIS